MENEKKHIQKRIIRGTSVVLLFVITMFIINLLFPNFIIEDELKGTFISLIISTTIYSIVDLTLIKLKGVQDGK